MPPMDNKRTTFEKMRPQLIQEKGCVCANCHVECGNDIIFHHVVPLSVGGTNNISNIVPVCQSCDGIIHSLDRTNWKALQRAGIEKAKAEGKYTGRKPMDLNKEQFAAMVADYRAGKRTATSIFTELGISATTFYRKIKQWEL